MSSEDQRLSYQDFALRSNKKIISYNANYILASIPVFIAFGLLSWFCYVGARATDKCFDVTPADDKPAIQRTLLANYTVIGVSIGIALSSLLWENLVGPFTKIFIGLMLIAVTSVAINSYMKLDESCDETKIIGQKKTMYTILGVAIGLIFNGAVMSFLIYFSDMVRIYVWGMILAIGMIIIGSFNIVADQKCNKDGLSSDEKQSVETARNFAISEIVIGSVLIIVIAVALYNGVGLSLSAAVGPETYDNYQRT